MNAPQAHAADDMEQKSICETQLTKRIDASSRVFCAHACMCVSVMHVGVCRCMILMHVCWLPFNPRGKNGTESFFNSSVHPYEFPNLRTLTNVCVRVYACVPAVSSVPVVARVLYVIAPHIFD